MLVITFQTSGIKSVVWDGTNNFGDLVDSGIYLYQIQVDDFIQSMKMLLIK